MSDPVFISEEEKPPTFSEEQIHAAAEQILPKPDETSEAEPDQTDEVTEKEVTEEEPQTQPEPEAGQESQEPPVEPSPVQVAEDDIEYDPGQRIPRSRVRDYVALDQILQANPELAQIISNYLTQQYESPAPTTQSVQGGQPVQSPASVPPPTPPAPTELDLDDPSIKYLYDTVQAQNQQLIQQQEYLRSIYPTLSRHEQFYQSRAQQETTSLVNRAVQSFQQQNGYTDDEMQAIRLVAGRMNTINTILDSGLDPVTGQPIGDNLTALERTLEIARDMIPEYRERAIANAAAQQRKDSTRKRKLGALSGSGGSANRSAKPPSTPAEYQEAMLRDVAAAMNGNSIPES